MSTSSAPIALLLVTTDPATAGGRKGEAWWLVRDRLERSVWPLFEGTARREAIEPGVRLAFYVGGNHRYAQHIVAVGVAERRSAWRQGAIDAGKYLTSPPVEIVRLRDIRYLAPPVNLREHLPRLSFRPKSDVKWGAALMGGIRKLTDPDWDVLVGDRPATGTAVWSASASVEVRTTEARMSKA